ncbi:lipid-A-disaccharide synthase [Pedobacter yulinensis]|uniref:Lipid-A-disaccharide synthase n=1 Tax=Pedobacter yulinensis TaxID=2126353 RepID=A0A2T3HIU5_9SPHI|nr:lipid-A-disaccharide synthase [Pedobacter yulinensis]PST82357.1 lipid-A-disaccharide synthase [Pedobacter yulinensis]
MRYYLVAGEASGDLHGANLMRAIKQQDAAAEFRFFGGDKMLAEGGVLAKHYRDMSFMGFVEVLANLRTIFRNLAACKNDLVAYRPDVLVLIDFPGFNLKIAKFAKEQGIPVCFYISPKVWAWNQKRVLNIKKVVDRMFCILPFEVEFYKSWGMEVTYVGNPLLDAVAGFSADLRFAEKQGLAGKKIIALLPGSRRQEIERLLPDMLAVSDRFPEYLFVVAGAPDFDESYYRTVAGSRRFEIVYNNTYNLLAVAHAAVVASGTATLETAIFKVPQVVVYKGSAISVAIARLLVKIRFISLVNLIADRKIVPELIQEDCNPTHIETELRALMAGAGRNDQLTGYEELAEKLGLPGASGRAAAGIIATAAAK